MDLADLKHAGDLVSEALTSCDAAKIASAEEHLRQLLDGLGSPSAVQAEAILEWSRSLSAIVGSAGEFYSGMASMMQVRLYGYGQSRALPTDGCGSRLSAQA